MSVKFTAGGPRNATTTRIPLFSEKSENSTLAVLQEETTKSTAVCENGPG